MRYGERKTVLRDARLRTTAAEDDALDRLADMMRRHGITGPYWYILGRDNADMSRNYSHIGHY